MLPLMGCGILSIIVLFFYAWGLAIIGLDFPPLSFKGLDMVSNILLTGLDQAEQHCSQSKLFAMYSL